MPIRFRCKQCNQLLGIARRKAGTMVRCPNCAIEVVVPQHDMLEPGDGPAPADAKEHAAVPAELVKEAPAAPPKPEAQADDADLQTQKPSDGPPGKVFERSDFGEVFRPEPVDELPPSLPMGPPGPAPAPQRPPTTSWKPDEEIDVNVERVPVPPEVLTGPGTRPGIWLSPTVATILSVLLILALALAFAGGLTLGLFLRPPT